MTLNPNSTKKKEERKKTTLKDLFILNYFSLFVVQVLNPVPHA
jgi:hypothetical protein